MRTTMLCLALLAMAPLNAQNIHAGIFLGGTGYAGELNEKVFRKELTHPVIGITANYEFSEIIMIRAGLSFGTLEGADRYSRDTFSIHRNLSFKSKITEFSALGEVYLASLYNHRLAPYLFGGLALFHYNPYAFDTEGNKVYLKPLSTEGQGIAGYPDRQPYSLTQLAIPFGAGLKFRLNDNLRVGLEVGLRKLFTDYLDDVSTSYIDEQELLQARGQKAVDMAFRGDEVDGFATYPGKGAQRGGSTANDYYYFGGLHLTYRIGGEKSAGSGGGGRGGKKSRFGCPANVQRLY